MRKQNDSSRRPIAVTCAMMVALLAACRAPQSTAPLPVSHSWQRDFLVVYSNSPQVSSMPFAEPLAAQLAEMAQVLGTRPLDQTIELYLFDNRAAMRSFLAHHHPEFDDRRALFVKHQQSLAIYAYWHNRLDEDLRHELTHGYLHAVAPGIPLWLDEGLAEYFEVGPEAQGFHAPHVELLAAGWESGQWRPDLKRLETLTSPQQLTQQAYAEAWLWVYFFLSGPPQRELLLDYLEQLESGEPGAFSAAADTGTNLEKQLVEFWEDLLARKNPPIAGPSSAFRTRRTSIPHLSAPEGSPTLGCQVRSAVCGAGPMALRTRFSLNVVLFAAPPAATAATTFVPGQAECSPNLLCVA